MRTDSRPSVWYFALIFVLILFPIQAVLGVDPRPDKKATVQKLIDQLGSSDAKVQKAATAELVKRGPGILSSLPESDEKLNAAQKKNLAAVRKSLYNLQQKRDLAPRLVTIQEKVIDLRIALAELAKQTGIEVADRRVVRNDPKFSLSLRKATFWQAIDVIANEVDARVSVYQRDGRIALAPRGEGRQNLPVSYNGLFRISVKSISARRDLETDHSVYIATLEVAWEPRFRPFILETQPQSVLVTDDENRQLRVTGEGESKLAVQGQIASTFDIVLPNMPRSAAQIGLLRGSIVLIGPTQMRTFTFPSLAVLEQDEKARRRHQDGVTIKVTKMDLSHDYWTIVMGLEYPTGGPQFESYESWLVYNEIHLQRTDGNKVFPNNGGYNIDSSVGTRAVISYNFVDERSKRLIRGQDLESWKLIYRAPGRIVRVPVSFQFRNIPLP